MLAWSPKRGAKEKTRTEKQSRAGISQRTAALEAWLVPDGGRGLVEATRLDFPKVSSYLARYSFLHNKAFRKASCLSRAKASNRTNSGSLRTPSSSGSVKRYG